jgi:hypothetical protein
MITGLVLVERGVEPLAATLSSLVPGAAEGLVGDAVVIARRADDDIARVADAMGASLVVSSLGRTPGRRLRGSRGAIGCSASATATCRRRAGSASSTASP